MWWAGILGVGIGEFRGLESGPAGAPARGRAGVLGARGLRGDADALADAKALLLPIDNARAKARESAASRRTKAKDGAPVAPAPGSADDG